MDTVGKRDWIEEEAETPVPAMPMISDLNRGPCTGGASEEKLVGALSALKRLRVQNASHLTR